MPFLALKNIIQKDLIMKGEINICPCLSDFDLKRTMTIHEMISTLSCKYVLFNV
jgi:hypothetical protein